MTRTWPLARTALAAVAGLCVCAGAAAGSAEAAKSPGLLGIAPPRRDVVARPPVSLPPTLVRNTTKLTFDMTVTPGLLIQYLDGTFDIDTSPKSLREAELILDVGPRKFTLPPNRQLNLHFRWVNLPRGARAAYVGLRVQGVPHHIKGVQINTVLRLLGVNFFRLPGPYRSSGRIVSLRGEQAEPKVLRFTSRVKNTGEVVDSPKSGHTIIEAAGGKHLVKLDWQPGVILPGFEREFPVLLKKVLPAGHYVAVSSMRFGRPAKVSVKRWPFTLVGPNELPTRDLSITKVGLSGAIGDPAHVTVNVKNSGTAPSPVVMKTVLSYTPRLGAQLHTVTTSKRTVGKLDVGKSGSYRVDLAKLKKGIYRARVTVGDGKRNFDTRDASVSPVKHKGFFVRIWDWIKGHFPWLLLALALLIILFLLWRRRRDDEDEEEEVAVAVAAGAPAAPVPAPAPARVPPPAPAPSPPPVRSDPAPGTVNLNDASVDELMTLPGIGRRAAERLIAHRESSGPFTSLDDLRAVEGFHDERIRRIADHVRV